MSSSPQLDFIISYMTSSTTFLHLSLSQSSPYGTYQKINITCVCDDVYIVVFIINVKITNPYFCASKFNLILAKQPAVICGIQCKLLDTFSSMLLSLLHNYLMYHILSDVLLITPYWSFKIHSHKKITFVCMLTIPVMHIPLQMEILISVQNKCLENTMHVVIYMIPCRQYIPITWLAYH